jgi:type IV secretory pathway TraG/TraD family ATPase VirD4
MRDERSMAWILIGVLGAVASLGLWLPWWLAERYSGAEPVPGGPLEIVKALKEGEPAWPGAATWWAVGLVGVLLVLLVLVIRLSPSRTVDRAARRLPRDSGLRRYVTGKGPRIGRVIRGVGNRRPLVRATEEDQIVVVAGPRTGKTTALAIPAAVAHDTGPLVITSNKRDIYDHIVNLRSDNGRVWLFDPLGLASDGKARWWWNPLQMTRDIRGARRLAAIWNRESKDPGAQADNAYFEAEGSDLLASLLLAASSGDLPVSAIYPWLARMNDPEPVEILRHTPGCELVAEGLQGRQDLDGRQRDGIFGTARKIVAWLDDPTALAWIERGDGSREQFDPSDFATSGDTLVSLSKESEGWATALVTALTASVMVDTEMKAAKMPGGRLERPMLGVLDEAANVCRWRELPDLYSHYGSRGIVLMSLFQSWAQMVEAFGPEGAEKLWSASNVRIYGGGVSDTVFLKRLSDLAGDWDHPHWSRSSGHRHGATYSRSTDRRPIYDVATLGSMPPGRALVVLSAARPVLVELQRWFDGPDAGRIRKAMASTDVEVHA